MIVWPKVSIDINKEFTMCFACGQENPIGLKLKFKQEGKTATGRKIDCEVLYKFNTKDMEEFHSKEEIDKHGLVVLAIRKKYKYR